MDKLIKLLEGIEYAKANDSIFIGKISVHLGVSANFFKDCIDEFPKEVEQLYNIVESNVVMQSADGSIPVTLAKMILQNFHNWEEKQRTEVVKKPKPKISFTYNGRD